MEKSCHSFKRTEKQTNLNDMKTAFLRGHTLKNVFHIFELNRPTLSLKILW